MRRTDKRPKKMTSEFPLKIQMKTSQQDDGPKVRGMTHVSLNIECMNQAFWWCEKEEEASDGARRKM